jgi:Flp pilus assembly protein TadB
LVDAQHRPEWEPVVIGFLAAAWGCVVVLPFVALVRRISAAERLEKLTPRRVRRGRLARAANAASARLAACTPVRTVGRVLRAPTRARRARRIDDEMARQVAVAVDLVGVGVAAGHTPYLAVQLGARWSPPLVARELDAAVRACMIGQSFDDALREMGRRSPGARGLADTLRTSARLGSPAAPALARLASEVRADLRRRAEARARTVPVRLCFPLVGCILPAFALLTVVPAVVAGVTR